MDNMDIVNRSAKLLKVIRKKLDELYREEEYQIMLNVDIGVFVDRIGINIEIAPVRD